MPTPARPKTRPGRLSDVARHVVLPEGIVSTGWPAVRDKCAEFGDSFDEWQDGAGRAVLAKRESGKYAATIDGVTLSIPRQVAKTFLVMRIIVALCVLFPGLTVLWTAHHGRTSTRTFRSMQGYVRRKKLWPHIAGIRTANGEQEIAFRNGSLIMFGAREQGFGRGFEEIDVEVFDEAQILTEKALEDMVAATNQSRHPHGALLFYMGTPPRPIDPGEAFTAKRRKALAGKMVDGVYIECSADPDADLDDRKQWAKANPSYPLRTPVESMLRLRSNLTSDDAWRREALGIWPPDEAEKALPGWDLGADPASVIAGNRVLALTMAPDSSVVALIGAGKRSDGHLHIETVLHGRPGKWFIDETKAISARQGCQVAVVASHPAGSMIPELEEAGVKVIKQSRIDYLQGCGILYNAAADGRLHYPPPQPELTAAIANASRKQAEQSWRWSGEGISALVAASQAVFEVAKAPQRGWMVSL